MRQAVVRLDVDDHPTATVGSPLFSREHFWAKVCPIPPLERIEVHEVREMQDDRLGRALAVVALFRVDADDVQNLGRESLRVRQSHAGERVPHQRAVLRLAELAVLFRDLEQLADVVQERAGDEDVALELELALVDLVECVRRGDADLGHGAHVVGKRDLDRLQERERHPRDVGRLPVTAASGFPGREHLSRSTASLISSTSGRTFWISSHCHPSTFRTRRSRCRLATQLRR
jgi:hypothetical protein